MEGYVEICGTPIEVKSIKEFRIVKREYIFRPVYEEIQKKMFEALELTEEEINNKFGFFVEALKYGTPPHGGLAFGLDRMTMLLAETDNIRDVIAFPKTASATDLMCEAPSDVSDSQLKELFGEALDDYIDSLSDLPEAEDSALTDSANEFANELLSNEQPSVVISELSDVDLMASLVNNPYGGARTEKKGSFKDTICFTKYNYDKECIYIDPQGNESYILGNYGS